MTQQSKDEVIMSRALELARMAQAQGDIPVGAVIVRNGVIIAESFNEKEFSHSATYHAEILAIERASKLLKSWRLTDCTLYVTLEPCVMCAGAIIQARLERVVFGCTDLKAGGISLFSILSDARLNHRPVVEGGCLAALCSQILREFFMTRRNQLRLERAQL